MDLVALEQRRDEVTVSRACRNLQQQVTVPERLVVGLQGLLVVTEPLKGPHDPGSQPVVAAILIQDACSALAAQDLHRRDVHPGRSEFAGDGWDLRVLGQQPHYVVDGPVIEVINIDLRLTHVAAPTRDAPGRCVNGACLRFCPAACVCRLARTDQSGRIA